MSLRAMLMSAAGASDTLPDAFTFPSTTGAEVNTSYTASYLPVGYDESTWTVTNGQGSTDNSSWATSGKITKGQTFYVKATSSPSYSTVVTATVTFGGYLSVTYSITTRAVDVTPNQFTFTDVTSATSLSTTYTSNTATLTGMDAWQTVTVTASGSGEIDAGTSTLSGTWSSTSKTANTGASGQIVVAARVTSNSTYSSTTSVKADINGISDTYSVTTKAADTIPDAFNFSDISNAELSTTYSSIYTPTGYDYANWSVTNGEGSTNGSTWATSGSITSGQTFYVRRTSSASYSTQVSADVNIGGQTDTWYITTKVAPDTTPDAFGFSDVSNASLNTLYSSSLTPTGYNTSTSWSVSGGGGQGSIDNVNWSTSGSISPGQTFYVRATSSGSFNTSVSVTVNIGGQSDTWYVTTRTADTEPTAFSFPSTLSGAALNTTYSYADYYGSVLVSGLEPNYTVTISAAITSGYNGTNAQVAASTYGSALGAYSSSVTATTDSSGRISISPRLTTSGLNGAAHSVRVTIGSQYADWRVDTVSIDTTPDTYSFTNKTGQALNSTIDSAVVYITGLQPSYSISWSTSGSTGASAAVATYPTTPTSFTTSGSATTDASGRLAVIARVTSSSSVNTTTYSDVYIGTGYARFNVTTANLVGPSAYTISTVSGVNPSSTQTQSFSLSGMTASVTYSASITSGTATLSSDNVTFATSINFTTSGTGTATLYIRDTASASYNTSKSSTVSINSVTSTWTVTTRAADLTPNQFTFSDITNAPLSTAQTSSTLTVTGMDGGQSITVTATGSGTVDAGTSTLSGTFAASKTVTTSATGTIVLAARVTSNSTYSSTASVTIGIGTVTDVFSVTTQAPPSGEAVFTTPTQFGSWTCPAGVTSVCVVCVGGGGSQVNSGGIGKGGGGGGLGYKNNISVTPGTNYSIVVGSATSGAAGGESYFSTSSTVKGAGGFRAETLSGTTSGGSYTGDGGGTGGSGSDKLVVGANTYYGGGGGAGGYSGNGGAGGGNGSNATAGNGGGGGGGQYGLNTQAGSGGGVGLYGTGTNGTAGSANGASGGGGSSGTAGSTAGGGAYGGGGGGKASVTIPGGSGAVRIIWGSGRSFPSNAT